MYTVEISPSAWSQLAHLTVDTYRRIREELDAVAITLTQSQGRGGSPPPPGDAPDRSPVVVEDTVAHYDVDHMHQCVRLLEVVHRRSHER